LEQKKQLQAKMRGTQNIQSNRVVKKTAQENNDKYEQRVTCSESSVVVALLLAYFQQKSIYEKKLLISKRNCKQKSAVKVVADGVYAAKS
jgi:hypothetical protein